MELDRRQMFALSGAAALSTTIVPGTAHARIRPADMEPLIGPGYRPTDRDEIGMWKLMERLEEDIAGSNILIDDPGLNAYLQDLIGRVGGPAAQDMRIYLARVPEFNAMMFPTGFSIVFSGLLLRMRNEAQLAGVIAHESAHFLRKHQIRAWRDTKKKSDIFSVLAMGAGVAGGAAGVYVGDFIQLGQLGTILSLLQYNRTLEAEADAMGIRLLAEAGYAPEVMSATWKQLLAELDQSAEYRGKRREKRLSLFQTHPSPEARMADLAISAKEVRVPGANYQDHRERYLDALGDWRAVLLDDQIKLNDPGASQYIVETLAQDGWNGPLRYAEAEIWRLRGRDGDFQRAANGYATAVLYPDAPADAWRWHGIALRRAGHVVEAQAAFATYLRMAPDAPDAAYIRSLAGGMQ